MEQLKGKTIAVLLSGSIGIVKSVEFMRELRRRGAIVQAVMSSSAKELLGEKSVEWASGNKVISGIEGNCSYLEYAGFRGKADLIIFFASANSISKMAQGISDSITTLYASTALGSGKPLLVVPLGHMELFANKIVTDNLKKLSDNGCSVFSFEEEGALKFPDKYALAVECGKLLSGQPLNGKKIVIASGATQTDIDDVRCISSNISGETGKQVAIQSYVFGAETILFASSGFTGISRIAEYQFRTTEELESLCFSHLETADYFFCPASISDFEVKKAEGKLPSGEKHSIALKPREKLLEKLRKQFPKLKICAFKLETGTEKQLEKKCLAMKKRLKLEIVVGNLKKNVSEMETRCIIFHGKRKMVFSGSKEKLAEKLLSLLK